MRGWNKSNQRRIEKTTDFTTQGIELAIESQLHRLGQTTVAIKQQAIFRTFLRD